MALRYSSFTQTFIEPTLSSPVTGDDDPLRGEQSKEMYPMQVLIK